MAARRSDFDRLARSMNNMAVRTELGSRDALRRVTRVTARAAIESTPVDTGAARSNWRVSARRPDIRVRFPFAPGERLGRGETDNLRAANAAVDRDVLKIGRLTRRAFLQNNVPYITKLNAGSSRQAPPMFVEMAIMRGIAAIRSRPPRIVDPTPRGRGG